MDPIWSKFFPDVDTNNKSIGTKLLYNKKFTNRYTRNINNFSSTKLGVIYVQTFSYTRTFNSKCMLCI